MNTLQNSRTVRGCIQGDSIPDQFVPRLVYLYRAGKLAGRADHHFLQLC
jgi:Zn-dependent alcohol dehydrogenase